MATGARSIDTRQAAPPEAGGVLSVCATAAMERDMPSTTSPHPSATPFSSESPWGSPSPAPTAEALRVSTDLHERLALGAKMLQALDLQMRRFEGGLAEQEAFARRIEQAGQAASDRLAELLARADGVCEGFASRLESLGHNRLEQWERQVAERAAGLLQQVEREMHERHARLDGGEQRVQELEARLRSLESSIGEASERFSRELREQVEQSNRQREEALVAIRAASHELLQTLQRAEEIRNALEGDLRQRTELLQRCRELDREVRGNCEAMLRQVRETAEHLHGTSQHLQPHAEQARLLSDRLEVLLTALQEWRPLLDQQLPQRLHQQAEQLFREGSIRMQEQIERVGVAFRSLSELLGNASGMPRPFPMGEDPFRRSPQRGHSALDPE
jgi:DNA repair exonuclease SbcCD ATPase subunit